MTLVGMLLDDQGYQSMSSNKVAAFVRVAGQHYPAWYPDRGFGIIEANVPLDLLNDTAAWGRTHFVQGGNGYYDDRDIYIYAWPGDPFPEGWYCLKRYRVFVPFETNYGESKIAVWAEPENTNGTISQLAFFDDAEIGYAALYPPDVSTNSKEGLTRTQGNLITYVFQVYDLDAQGNPNTFLGWWPTSPSEIGIEFSTWGKMHPEIPQNLQGTYNSRLNNITLNWDRNDPQDGVSRYQIYRRIDYGPWQHLAYRIDPGYGSTVQFVDRNLGGAEEVICYKVKADGYGGWSPWSSEIEVFVGGGPMMMGRQVSLPTELTLELNYPNPFNPSTHIRFGLPASTHVRLQIMNIRGQTVRVLIDEEKLADWHTVTWDGKNESGREVASGIYLYMIEADNKKILKRMTLIR